MSLFLDFLMQHEIRHSPPKSGGKSMPPFVWIPACAGMTEKKFGPEYEQLLSSPATMVIFAFR